MILLYHVKIYYSQETLNGPDNPNDFNDWLDGIQLSRENELKSIQYNGSIYNVDGIKWTQGSFIQPQMHPYDLYFFDSNTGEYTVDKWLNDLNTRYGGIDSFLLWATYTNIGCDDRNQYQMNYALPGGIDSLRNITTYVKEKYGINVLFPYNPWDQGTQILKINGIEVSEPEYMAYFLNITNGDGFNGDTMGYVDEDFYTYSVNKYSRPIAIEPELGGNLAEMNYGTMGWGYWSYTYKPLVGYWKWLDGRRMTNICDRWAQNRTDDIQNAYFNGIGFESWENVWGIWNGITPRDAAAIKRSASILRYFGQNGRRFTQSLDWIPFIPINNDNTYGTIFASKFPINIGQSNQETLWLIINRNNIDVINYDFVFNNDFKNGTVFLYDCYYGTLLQDIKPTVSEVTIKINIEGLGYGCILATYNDTQTDTALNSFLKNMNTITKKPLNEYSAKWDYLQQQMKPIQRTKEYSSAPSGMIEIPWNIYYFNVNGVEIEGNDNEGVDVQYPWELYPKREHSQYINLPQYYIDQYPVTCKQYRQYLMDSGYKPKDPYNYLKNWNFNTSIPLYPSGYDNKPVTYLGINEAREYCEYYGKRLPHNYEWQYAGQGNTDNIYPWGNDNNQDNYPKAQHGRYIPGPENVDSYDGKGQSIFNVSDLIGNIWQYTDEFSDIHTRAVIVRGSANYRPSGSQWYFPTAYQLNEHNKYFLMNNRYERSGTIGFRCVADSIQPSDATDTPINWKGTGNYCNNIDDDSNMKLYPFCGRINAPLGYTNLTHEGNLDWVNCGLSNNDNDPFKIVRKDTDTQYIGGFNIINNGNIDTFDNNVNAFYWNDGRKNESYSIVTKNERMTNGIYISGPNKGFSFTISNLKKGNAYKLKIYVGVYKKNGLLQVTTMINNKEYKFIDDTNNGYIGYNGINTVVYEIIIDLTNETNQGNNIQISWTNEDNNDGNITLESIALSLL